MTGMWESIRNPSTIEIEHRIHVLLTHHSLRSRLASKELLTATLFSKIFCCYFAEFRINVSLRLLGLWIPSVAISLFYVHLWNNLTTYSLPRFHSYMIPNPSLPQAGPRMNTEQILSTRLFLFRGLFSQPFGEFIACLPLQGCSCTGMCMD